MQYTRMACWRRLDVSGSETKVVFALVKTVIEDGETTQVVLTEYDSYALVDYWATMYNVGAATEERCVESLELGMKGVPRDQASREDFAQRRFGGIPGAEEVGERNQALSTDRDA